MASSYFPRQLLFCGFANIVQAYTTFETTCSTPSTQVNFVSSPNSRGSLDILWSSLFTIVTCTWTVLHLNIPEQRNGRDSGWKGGLKWKLKDFYTNAKWMLITMVAPEMIVGTAYYDLVMAHICLRKLQAIALEDQVPWTLTHCYFANMGGFVIQSGSDIDATTRPSIEMENVHSGAHPYVTSDEAHSPSFNQLDEAVENNQSNPELADTTSNADQTRAVPELNEVMEQSQSNPELAFTALHARHNLIFHQIDKAAERNQPNLELAHATSDADQTQAVAEPNEVMEQSQSNPELASSVDMRKLEHFPYQNPFHLDARMIYQLRQAEILLKLPLVSEEELNDKSKSDSFVKTIAVVQIGWATLQIIVRAARRLAISQLELAVIAFAACAIVIYILYWAKPKGVRATITILQYEHQIPLAVLQKLKLRFVPGILRELLSPGSHTKRDYDLPGSRPKNDTGFLIEPHEEYEGLGVVAVMTLGAILFGGIHVGAWNFEFPTQIELILWRCASIYAVAIGPGLSLIRGICAVTGTKYPGKVEQKTYPISIGLYAFARLFLLVEMFRTLWFLPSNAYISTWATNVPHIT